jgi:hypothetical protein
MHMSADDPAPRSPRRARLAGRLFITGVLLAGGLGGLWAVRSGKRLAEERKARMRPATTAPAAP